MADNLERDLILLALVGIEDPLRPEVPAAIASCQRAGIEVKMVTGDNAGTATAIARQCGILPPEGGPGTSGGCGSTGPAGEPPLQQQQQQQHEFAVMEGSEFRRRVLAPDGSIRAAAFLEIWPQLRVLARCTPADKFTVVKGEQPGAGSRCMPAGVASGPVRSQPLVPLARPQVFGA